ncbi:hypothetical protein [Archangium violaceum]|uniref:hypothetical protein n=1 Tax=Archangium violaceum TaxID=83451 RepID=UPI0037BE480F
MLAVNGTDWRVVLELERIASAAGDDIGVQHVVVPTQLDEASGEFQRLVVVAAVVPRERVAVRVLLNVEALRPIRVNRVVVDVVVRAGVIGIHRLAGRLGAGANVDALAVVILVALHVVALSIHPAPLDDRVGDLIASRSVSHADALAAGAVEEHVANHHPGDVARRVRRANVDEPTVSDEALVRVLEIVFSGAEEEVPALLSKPLGLT